MNQPTGCGDARPSPVHFGEVSEQACKKVNDKWWKEISPETLELQGSHYKKETLYQRKGAYSMQLIMFN